jgi:hypothetical protein
MGGWVYEREGGKVCYENYGTIRRKRAKVEAKNLGSTRKAIIVSWVDRVHSLEWTLTTACRPGENQLLGAVGTI